MTYPLQSALCILTAAATLAFAGPGNYNQQGIKLVGSGAVGQSTQGTSVAVSADGNTALVGGPNDNNGFGAVWVFTRSNGIWSQQGGKLLPSDASNPPNFGAGVAISADGNTAAVAGPFDTTGTIPHLTSGGAVWVFTRSAGVWTQQGSKLFVPGSTQFPLIQAWNVALSGDGNTLAEGLCDESGLCSVAVFTRANGAWTHQVTLQNASFDAGEGVMLLASLSADGKTLAVGDFSGQNLVAFAQVFGQRNGVWSQEGGYLQCYPGNPFFISSVGLSSDGNNLLCNNFLFNRKSGVWLQPPIQLNSSNGSVGQFVISSDATTIVAGNYGPLVKGNSGVDLFNKMGGVWTRSNHYSGQGATTDFRQGISVALSGNGNTMIFGGPLDDNAADPSAGVGAAWIFASPQLSASLKHTGNFHRGQTGANYSITVTNVGDRDIHAAVESAVNIIDNLPSGLIATGIAGTGWSCTLATVSCTRSDGLAVGASFPPVTVTVTVALNAPASLINSATASGGGSTWGGATDLTTIVP